MNKFDLPKWLRSRWEALREAFGDAAFSFSDAVRVFSEHGFTHTKESVKAALSELSQRGFLSVTRDKWDARKKLYRITEPQTNEETAAFGRGDLERLMKQAADLIRTRVDYFYILLLLFYKRLSDVWRLEYERAYKEALEDGFTEEEAAEEARQAAYHDFQLPEGLLWDDLRKDPENLPENLSKAFKAIGEANPELRPVFANADFVTFTINPENKEVLAQLFELFSARDLSKVDADVLGDAYEWLLRYFAPAKAKEGEVYTPREVIRLMVEMVQPRPGESVYDPACGSGGMLLVSYRWLRDREGPEEADTLLLYGQEVNPKTLALAKMNLLLHNIKNHHLEAGDTLLRPRFTEGGGLKRFDVVLTNPPWNQDGYPEEKVKGGHFWAERFRFGFVPQKSADWLWIQHVIASLKDAGRAAVVIDNGALFRGGKERAVRSEVLEADLVEAVILLPEKLFYNTGAPGAIMVFRKGKPAERKGKVLFINASREFVPHPEVRKLNTLSPENIRKIAEAYEQFSEEEGFSRVVSLEEIAENDYNLNVSLYVHPVEDEEQVDVAQEWRALEELNAKLGELDEKVKGFLKELGYFNE